MAPSRFRLAAKNDGWAIEIVQDDALCDTALAVKPTSRFGRSTLGEPARGVIVRCDDGTRFSSLLVAAGGPAELTERSAIVDRDALYVAVGNRLYCLGLPTLEERWSREVDIATCWGVYVDREHDRLITHGECEIACLHTDGDIVWRVDGKDIFTGPFRLVDSHIEAEDFAGQQYRIALSDGATALV